MAKSKTVTHKRAKTVARRQTPLRQATKAPASPPAKAPTKLDTLIALLSAKRGATVPDMMEATGWQSHSVRGALAGAIRKRGCTVTSQNVDGERRYRIETAR